MDAVPSSLDVRLNGYPVGVLSRLPGNVVAFHFTQQFIDDRDRPTLSWGFYDANGRLRRLQPPSSFGSVPAFFANLLPEGDLRRYVARRAGVSEHDDFALLWLTGDDLPGAVTLHDPLDRALPPPIAGRSKIDVPPGDLLRFSLAGVQLKFSAIEDARGGLSIPAQGKDGHWVVKLPSRHFERVPENEYAMLRFAEAVGISVPEISLVDVDAIHGLPEETHGLAGRALISRRFDRCACDLRVHIEDFNQVFRQAPAAKYDNRSFADIAATVHQALGVTGLEDFMRRLVFNIGIANNDMHLKNWSFIYRDGRTPELAPAYDFVCTKVYVHSNHTGLPIGSARFSPDVTMEQLGYLASRARLSRSVVERAATDMIGRMLDAWKETRDSLPFANLRATIEEQFARVPLFNRGRVSFSTADAGEEIPREIA